MKYKLGEIAEITMGQSPKSQYYNNTGDGIPFLQEIEHLDLKNLLSIPIQHILQKLLKPEM